MVSLESKGFDAPDEVRPFADRGQAQVLNLAGSSVIKGRFEPGWRWSDHVRPIAGTDSCQSPHFLYVVSGRMHIAMNDGTAAEAGPDQVVHVDPGHDAWVVGDEPCITVDFGASPAYAAKSS